MPRARRAPANGVATIVAVESLYRRAYSLAHRTRDFLTARSWSPNWSEVHANPTPADPLDAVRLFAIVSTYNEADIISASVNNALAQGAERVYVVDNASTDDTVAQASAAGAIVVERFETTYQEDRLRMTLMSAAVWRISSSEGDPHIWWLWMDADEFSHGPNGQSIAEYLSNLDRRFRVVGADVYQHFPDTEPGYVPGLHPLDFQPLCEPFWQEFMPRCTLHHWKHPLARFDRTGPFLFPTDSFHAWSPNDRTRLNEPDVGIVTHHFQYRDEATTRRRLEMIWGAKSGRADQMLRTGSDAGARRLRSLDAVYHQRWHEVDNNRHVPGDVGVSLRPWSELDPEFTLARWYSLDELEAARHARRER